MSNWRVGCNDYGIITNYPDMNDIRCDRMINPWKTSPCPGGHPSPNSRRGTGFV
ncbi:MAG: hypothetical protein ACYTXA_25220 [Nostoc sp.]